jgi:outer membrane protein assembly factor BamB
VQPALRGQPIRCPNATCRKIFRIAPEPPGEGFGGPERAPKTGPPPENGQRSGSVGEMVPILSAEPVTPPTDVGTASKHVSEVLPLAPAEPVAPAAEVKSTDGDWWQGPPAARQTPSRPAANPPAVPSAPPPAAPVEGAWWRDAPPPPRNPQAKADSPAKAPDKPPTEPMPRSVAPTRPMPATVLETPDQPRELPPGVWEPPPVRRGGAAADEHDIQPPQETPPAETPPAETHQPRVGKRHARWLIAVLIVVPLVVIGGGGLLTWLTVHKSEDARFAEAKAEYEQRHYREAAGKFHELADKFPNSERAPEYRFLEEWSMVCSAADDPSDNLAGAVAKLDQFIKDHKKDPLMAPYGHDAGQLLLRLTKAFAEHTAAASEPSLAATQGIEQLRSTVQGLGPDALTRADGAQVESDLGKVRTAVLRRHERQEVLDKLHQLRDEKPFDAIKRSCSLVDWKKRDLPGLDEDAEVRAALDRLYEKHQASVVYQPRAEDGPAEKSVHLEDDAPSLAFASLLSPAAPGNAPDNDSIVLALARGVLYALKQSNGELKWATRVGPDTTVLPQRVPASQASPELFLVLSADTQTLTALDADSNQVWEYAIGQPVLGRPVLIDQRAYLAAYDGFVHEIELAGGKLLGRYSLGQRLTGGGAREGDSKRLYFPADDSCIYVLDVGQKCCVAILYDGHPSGSLRSAPIVIPPERRDAAAAEAAGNLPEGEEVPGYLILNQASGLDAMRLRVFQLPLRDRHAAPLDLKQPAELKGWTWFEPYHDGEKLAVLSDAGKLGLFGIRQPGNLDQALFPLLKPGGLDLSPFLGARSEAARERGRAQVVHMQDNDLWVLAHGCLQQVQLLWKDPIGPLAKPGWPKPPVLGSPLHAPQPIEDRAGRSTFFLVTQRLDRQICIASAVDDEGHKLWQRQLGLVFQGEPLALTSPQGGPPLLLALDQGGGLFVLDPSQPTDRLRAMWKSLDSAPALDDNPRVPPSLLLSADGHSAYEIAAPGDGAKLLVRQVEWAKGGRSLRVRAREVSLLSPSSKTPLLPAGTPAVVGTQLIVPMAEGYDAADKKDLLARLLLPLGDEQSQLDTSGPNWRDRWAALNAPGHVLPLGGDRFLTSNGSRGVEVWEWPKNGVCRGLPDGRDQPHQLPYRVAAPPALLPAKAGQTPRIVVGDSAGVLRLLAVSPDGSLRAVQQWDLKGRITTAPFVHELPDGGVRIGCVLDQRQLVWLDPSRPKPLWTYRTGGEAIVGRPQRVEDLLVVALQSGRYVGLDPATGEAKGPGYTLRASAAPAATPVPFGPDRMLTPLSDGTALLLSPKLLRQPEP